MDRLQPVLNAAARSVYNSRKYDRISPPLRDLHWLRVPERIKFCLAVSSIERPILLYTLKIAQL